MNEPTRRQYIVTISTVGVSLVAGCSSTSGGEENSASTKTTDEPREDTGTATETGDESEGDTKTATQTAEPQTYATEGDDSQLIQAPLGDLRLSREALPGGGWTVAEDRPESGIYRRDVEEQSLRMTITVGVEKTESVNAAKSEYTDLIRSVETSSTDFEVNIAVESVAGVRPTTDGSKRVLVVFRDANAVGAVQVEAGGQGIEQKKIADLFDTAATLAAEMHQTWRN
jgi:hypothetical protein